MNYTYFRYMSSVQSNCYFWLSIIKHMYLPVSSRSADLTGPFTEGGTP
jgi:hypothetical protein